MIPLRAIDYLYLAYGIGVVVLGEAVLLPGIYLGYTGRLDLLLVLGIGLLAGILADALWYTLGRLAPKNTLTRYRFVRKKLERASAFDAFFRRHTLRVLFYSKFFYGTRVVFQLLAGLYRVPIWQYLLVTLASNSVWLLGITMIGMGLGAGLASLEETVFGIQIALTALLVVLILIYFGARWSMKRLFKNEKLRDDSSENDTKEM